MRLLFKITLWFFFAFGLSSAAVEQGQAEINPDHPGKCWIADRGEAFAPGGEWQLKGTCGKGACNKSVRHGLIYVRETCGVVASPPNCKLVESKNKPKGRYTRSSKLDKYA
ncbi:hypothetical protein SK128_004524 [Halocaridina rubra]|uniref:Single domain-containing protein n=1 Tax=Halocaridina rubra TaxID=373956 RepID=A0AAN8XA95_HALRR